MTEPRHWNWQSTLAVVLAALFTLALLGKGVALFTAEPTVFVDNGYEPGPWDEPITQ